MAIAGALGLSAPPAFAATYGHVDTSIKDGAITIGNDAISRTFSFKDGNLKTTLIDNKLGHVQIVPGAGSEEFVIEGMVEGKRQEPESALTSVKPGRAGQTAAKDICLERGNARQRNASGICGHRRR